MEEAKRRIKACWEKEEPFCSSSCPFHYDIREFTNRLKRGSFNAAYRTFANSVGFPAIVAALCDQPCQSACPRKQTDAPIEMRRLEQSALDFAVNTKPNSYNMPPKSARIAIIGGGLSGLGCALRLTNRKYQVTVFEQSNRIGGSLWGKLAPEIFEADIETQFMYEQYQLCLNQQIEDIAPLAADYDAVYIATGAGGTDFGLLPTPQEGQVAPYATSLAGVFLGGALSGATDMEALAQGLAAAGLIEAYLKTGNMKGATTHPPTRMQLDPGILSYQQPIVATASGYDKEQALLEAKRCLGCRCDACYRHCPLMNYFEKFPLRIADEVAVTIDPGTLDGNGTVATRLISTCNQCGLCAEVCPQQIDAGHFLRLSHQAMRAKGAMPWAFHDFWLRDMAEAQSESAAFHGGPQENPSYLFFPGCQLPASEPNYVLGAYKLLLEAAPDTAIRLGCCGAPALWAGDEPLREELQKELLAIWQGFGRPTFILACPSCRQIFDKYLPQISTIFLLDFFAEQGISPQAAAISQEIAVFDPCSMRNYQASRENVRALAAKAGYTTQELPYHGQHAQCCSFGGQMDITNPPYKEWLVKQRTTASPLPYLVYCSNCRDIFAAEGKEVTHALELFPGCKRSQESAPGIEQRRQNRRIVKREIVSGYFPEQTAALPTPADLPTLRPVAGLLEKLDQERIFLAEIAAVIQACEKNGRRLRKANGHFVAHLRLGYLTYWVEYLPENGAFTLFNAYAHRMKIEGEGDGHE